MDTGKAVAFIVSEHVSDKILIFIVYLEKDVDFLFFFHITASPETRHGRGHHDESA